MNRGQRPRYRAGCQDVIELLDLPAHRCCSPAAQAPPTALLAYRADCRSFARVRDVASRAIVTLSEPKRDRIDQKRANDRDNRCCLPQCDRPCIGRAHYHCWVHRDEIGYQFGGPARYRHPPIGRRYRRSCRLRNRALVALAQRHRGCALQPGHDAKGPQATREEDVFLQLAHVPRAATPAAPPSSVMKSRRRIIRSPRRRGRVVRPAR
jgi:hypothetical protein